MKKKNVLTVILAFCLVFALAACGNGGTGSTTSSKAASKAESVASAASKAESVASAASKAESVASAASKAESTESVPAEKVRKIGIIGAMDEEVEYLAKSLTDSRKTTVGGMDFYEGKLDGKDVVVVQCGIGKVNAGTCAQLIINIFGATSVINTGVAGSLDANIDIGDIVVSTEAIQHDFDLTPLGYEIGELDEPRIVAMKADETLRKEAVKAIVEAAPEVKAFEGRVLSGDQFIASKEKKEYLVSTFDGKCCEMEGAAISQVCYRNEVPFVIIRAISDKADDSEEMSYLRFEKEAAAHCAAIVRYMVANGE